MFEVLNNGLKISTGLTVILGKRSSGKSYTLDRIDEQFDNAKYIRQFKLLSKDDAADQQQFENLLRSKGSSIAEEFLAPFKAVVEDVSSIHLDQDEQDIEQYLKLLKQAALEAEKQDAFAKCKLFHETCFEVKSLDSLERLIDAVDLLLQNTEYKDTIEQYLPRKSLLELGIALRAQFIREHNLGLKARYVNDMVTSIQNELQVRSSNTAVPDVDFYRVLMNKEKVSRFIQIAQALKWERVIEK